MWALVLDHILKHWKPYAIASIVAISIALAGISGVLLNSLLSTQDELRRVNNVINAKVDEIQTFDSNLNIAESDLRIQKDLISKYKKELNEMDLEFKKLTKDYNLKLKTRDSSIAYWKGRASGGTQTITTPKVDGETFDTVVEIDVKELCGGKTLAYEWKDNDLRFHLYDPDISVSGDEVFEYKQYVSIRGYVFSDDTGQIQIKRIEVKEVTPVERDGDTVYLPIPGQNVKLVDSKFEYINSLEHSNKWSDVFGIRALVLMDTNLYPGIGIEVLNLGRWIDWANVGLYGKLAFNVQEDFSNLNQSTVGAGVLYHFVPPLVNTNMAIGISANTPFNHVGRIMLSIDAIFFLNNW